MAFLTGAIDKENFKRFVERVTRSHIADLHATPFREGFYYVVNLSVSMDPEMIVEVLEQYNNSKPQPSRERPNVGRREIKRDGKSVRSHH